jgi:hypothetical protein
MKTRGNLAGFVHAHILPAAYTMLPARMASERASAMLLAIGLQESGFEHRRQINGPACSLWQFERVGVAGVLGHRRTADDAQAVLRRLKYQPVPPGTAQQVHWAMEHNDVLACCLARLLLWTLPEPLPGMEDIDNAWQQYLAAWRPGKPHRQTWSAHYRQAWALVTSSA